MLNLPDYQLNRLNYPPKWNKPENPISIKISAHLHYSESEEKVEKAIKNIFPKIELRKTEENDINGFSTNEISLFNFCLAIFDQKILDVARKCVIDGIITTDENKFQETNFFLNKQIAYINKVNFCSKNESPLGPISISIACSNLDLLIDTFFPKFEWFTSKEKKE